MQNTSQISYLANSSDAFVAACRDEGYRFVLITETEVERKYAKPLLDAFKSAGLTIDLIVFPAGEASKTREMKAQIEDQLFALGCRRDTCLIALGGGVVSDLVGFIAATFCRGINVIYCPTTLLSMVDAAVGGKTAVNTPAGKNLIGAFKQPNRINIDINTLSTLSDQVFKAGLVESMKHALILDADLFQFMQTQKARILTRDQAVLTELVKRNVEIKLAIVVKDETEQGLREILNYGHTVGHAIERVSDYQISHGAAVAIGLVSEAKLAVKLGILALTDLTTIEALLSDYDIDATLPENLSVDEICDALLFDKKIKQGQLRCVILEAIGRVKSVESGFSKADFKAVLA
jgi:3-dehydroquinate synthase